MTEITLTKPMATKMAAYIRKHWSYEWAGFTRPKYDDEWLP